MTCQLKPKTNKSTPVFAIIVWQETINNYIRFTIITNLNMTECIALIEGELQDMILLCFCVTLAFVDHLLKQAELHYNTTYETIRTLSLQNKVQTKWQRVLM